MRHDLYLIHCDDDDPTDESAAEETLKYDWETKKTVCCSVLL